MTKSGTRAVDHAGGNRHLYIPPTAKVLERQFLAPPRGGMDLAKLNIKDIIINLLGFIPLGFVLSATLDKLGGMFRKCGIFLAVAACFFVSLVIETLSGLDTVPQLRFIGPGVQHFRRVDRGDYLCNDFRPHRRIL